MNSDQRAAANQDFTMSQEVLTDQIHFILDHETFQKFEKAIEAPLDPAAAEALARLLAHCPAWAA